MLDRNVIAPLPGEEVARPTMMAATMVVNTVYVAVLTITA